MSAKSLGFRLTQWLSQRLPDRCAFGLAERIADLQWRWSAADRRAVESNLERIGEGAAREDLARDVFRNFGRYLVEFFTIHQVPDPDVQIEGEEHLRLAHRRGGGAIVLTAHLGNWEVGAVLIHRLGFSVSVVALPHEDPRLDSLFNRQRRRCGLRVIPLGAAASQRSLQALREGQVLGLLGDREFADHGLTLPVCGSALMIPRGPATLSLRSHSPIVPTFLIREGLWKFRLSIEPPLWPDTDEVTETTVRELSRRHAEVFERYLKRFPAQWLMFQPVLGMAG